jgi:bifunctional DNA-binding transcriptional regulator/antitoxin component of YhaV-PrlF toxin-antitoxin module
MMSVLLKKGYDNKKGYFYIPVVWREEFQFEVGGKVSLDVEDDKIIIDKHTNRRFTQLVGVRGRITIPIEVREVLKNQIFQMLDRQDTEQLILIPA